MSYSVYVECPCCGRSSAGWNYTTNCAPMWREAGADLGDFDGRTVADCLPRLLAAIDTMVAEPERFRAFDAPNGWGSYDTLLPALRRLAQDMRGGSPHDRIRVSR